MTTLEIVLAALSVGNFAGWVRSASAARKADRHSRNLVRVTIERVELLNEMLNARLRDVEPREAAFRKALAYYAHASTWAAPERHKHSAAAKDRGEIARGALEAGQ